MAVAEYQLLYLMHTMPEVAARLNNAIGAFYKSVGLSRNGNKIALFNRRGNVLCVFFN